MGIKLFKIMKFVVITTDLIKSTRDNSLEAVTQVFVENNINDIAEFLEDATVDTDAEWCDELRFRNKDGGQIIIKAVEP